MKGEFEFDNVELIKLRNWINQWKNNYIIEIAHILFNIETGRLTILLKNTKMTKEEKYKKALETILNIVGNIREQDIVLYDIYKIAKDVLE